MQNIYLVMSIIKKSEAPLFTDFFLSLDVAPLYSTICQGAAHQSKLELFGLQKSEKVLMQSIVPEDKIRELMYRLTHEMKIDLPDKGVAIAIPLSSIASRKVYDKIISTVHEEDKLPSNFTHRIPRSVSGGFFHSHITQIPTPLFG